jgi:hypothetical protein
MQSFIGDTGRYDGIASLLSLIIVGYYFIQYKMENIQIFLLAILISAVVVITFGTLQYFNLLSIAGAGGITSIFGNSDFYSSWLGITFPLISYFISTLLNKFYSAGTFIIYLLICVFALHTAGAKQGWIDVSLAIIIYALIFIAKLIGFNFFEFFEVTSIKIKTLIYTLAISAITEIIFITPVLHWNIPGVSKDPNVQVREDFWYSGLKMFLHHPWVGVGAGNFGYYYQQYRSVSSLVHNQSVITNDAHSAMVETFSTLGIFATLAFIALGIYLIYCLVDMSSNPKTRRYVKPLSIFFFVYFVNSLNSPLTLPTKAIFWAVAGLVVGHHLRNKRNSFGFEFQVVGKMKSIFIAMFSVIILMTGITFAYGSANLIINQNALRNHKKITGFHYEGFMPCELYYDFERDIMLAQGDTQPGIAKTALKFNPRCIDAEMDLLNYYLLKKDAKDAKSTLDVLIAQAPKRGDLVVEEIEVNAMLKNSSEVQKYASQGLNLGYLQLKQKK